MPQETVREIIRNICANFSNGIRMDYIEISAISKLAQAIRERKKKNSWAENDFEGNPTLCSGYNQAIEDIARWIEK
jgi:hypothetical protein